MTSSIRKLFFFIISLKTESRNCSADCEFVAAAIQSIPISLHFAFCFWLLICSRPRLLFCHPISPLPPASVSICSQCTRGVRKIDVSIIYFYSFRVRWCWCCWLCFLQVCVGLFLGESLSNPPGSPPPAPLSHPSGRHSF